MLLQFGGGTAGGGAGGGITGTGGLSPGTATQALEASDRNALSQLLMQILQGPGGSGSELGRVGGATEPAGIGTYEGSGMLGLGLPGLAGYAQTGLSLGRLAASLAGLAGPASVLGLAGLPASAVGIINAALQALGVPTAAANPLAGLPTQEEIDALRDINPTQAAAMQAQRDQAMAAMVESALQNPETSQAGWFGGAEDVGAGWGASTGVASGFGAGEEASSGLAGEGGLGGGLGGDTGGLGGSDMGSSADSGIGGGGLY